MTAVVRLRPGGAGPVPGEESVGPPGPGEVRLRQTALGLDRCGLDVSDGADFVPGLAAAGEAEAVGAGVGGTTRVVALVMYRSVSAVSPTARYWASSAAVACLAVPRFSVVSAPNWAPTA